MTVLTGREIWRKYAVDGVPASGPNRPGKADIVPWATWLESMLSAGVAGLAKATRALLAADIYHAADSTAIVYADADPANNGIYVKSGISGDGGWTRIGDLPGDVIRLTVTGGTGNAIVATAPVTPSVPGNKLFLLTPSANCSGASTISINGGAATPIKTALASDTVTGSLVANSTALLTFQVDHYQLLVSLPVDASGILNDAIAARTGAQTAQAAAEAAAAALGNQVRTYDTVAQAQAATIPVGVANVRVVRDATSSRLVNRTYVPGLVSDPGAFAESGGHYWKPDFSSLPTEAIFSSRAALAAATVPPLLNVALCFGFATAGDCTPFMMKRVDADPRYGGVRSTDRYLTSGTASSGNGGWWVYMPGPAGVDACAFGYRADWNGSDAGATDSTAALQEAICFASQSFGTGFDSGGGGGGDVLVPMGSAMISALVIVHDGVRVLGKGTYGSIFKMKNSFSTTSHFFELGTPGDVAAIAASQTRASAGDLVINGTLASGGVARFLQKRVPTIYSAGDDSGRTFTVYGTDVNGASINAPVLGANVGKVDVPGFFLTVTRVAVDGATASTVTVGFEHRASFGCKLEQVQLFTDIINAASGKAMVYTNKAQHTAGLEYVKIFAGNRHATRFETGYGGASLFTYRHVETYNHGNEPGVASNNSQIYFNYAGLLTPISDIVMAGPGRAIGGAGAKGMEIAGGFVTGRDIHAEGLATGIYIDIVNENSGNAKLSGVIGGAAMDQLIWITNQTDDNTIMLDAIYPNSADHTVKDEPAGVGVFVNGNIHLPTLF